MNGIELDFLDADNRPVTIHLFDDVFDRMTVEDAKRGVTVQAHVRGIITDAARRITADTEAT